MKTIGAKELRLNLEQVLKRVLDGEEVVIKHRFMDPVRLSPLREQGSSAKKLSGLQAFDKAEQNPSPYDKRKSIKELYDESISTKYNPN